MFNFNDMNKKNKTEGNVKQPLKEVVIHYTPHVTYIYKNYYERDFEGTLSSPTEVLYLRDSNEKLLYINGSYSIINVNNEIDIKRIIEKFRLVNVVELSLEDL